MKVIGWSSSDAEQATLQKATRLKLYFSNVSFVGPDALSPEQLGDHRRYAPGPVEALAQRPSMASRAGRRRMWSSAPSKTPS